MSDLIALIGTNEPDVCPPAVAVGGQGQQGYRGRKGVAGADGKDGFTRTTASFVTGVNVEISVEDDAWQPGYVFIEGAGTYYVSDVEGQVLTATSTGEPGNLPHNSVIPAGRLVTAGSVAGPDVTTTEVRPYVLLASRLADGVDQAGGQYLRRPLTELVDTHNRCALWTNDTFILSYGTWVIRATSSSYKQGAHHVTLSPFSNPANTVAMLGSVRGSSEWNDADLPTASTRSSLFAILKITSPIWWALIHTASNAFAARGFGIAANFGVPETYAYLEARMS